MQFKFKKDSNFMQSHPIQYSLKTFQVRFYANQGLFQEETAQPSVLAILCYSTHRGLSLGYLFILII